jgi:hypothetical protein
MNDNISRIQNNPVALINTLDPDIFHSAGFKTFFEFFGNCTTWRVEVPLATIM